MYTCMIVALLSDLLRAIGPPLMSSTACITCITGSMIIVVSTLHMFRHHFHELAEQFQSKHSFIWSVLSWLVITKLIWDIIPLKQSGSMISLLTCVPLCSRLLLGDAEGELSSDPDALACILQRISKEGNVLKGPPGYQVLAYS